MGFIRQQEERLALRLLAWQYQRMNLPLPHTDEMVRLAAKLVDDAHRIAARRGRNVIAIIRELVDDINK